MVRTKWRGGDSAYAPEMRCRQIERRAEESTRNGRVCAAKVIEDNFQAKQEFGSGIELHQAVQMYFDHQKDSIDEIGITYGFPIGK